VAQPDIDNAMKTAIRHHQEGRIAEAEKLYRWVTSQRADHAPAIHLLGVVALQAGRNAEAVDLIRNAIKIAGDLAEAHGNLGIALSNQGKLDAAVASFREAIRLKPDNPRVLNNMGNTLAQAGDVDAALKAFRLAIEFDPSYAAAYSNLRTILQENGQPDQAVSALRQAIALSPAEPRIHKNLGNALVSIGNRDDAIAAYRKAIQLDPAFSEARLNLGVALHDQGRLDEAADEYRQAVKCRPGYAEAHYNLGNVLHAGGKLDDAIEAYRRTIALSPSHAAAHCNLGNVLKDQARLDDAIACCERAIELEPQDQLFHSNRLYLLHFHPRYDERAIAEEHHRWNDGHAAALSKLGPPYLGSRDPVRRLRVGYVSPDFRDHCQSFFTLPLLSHHDRDRFEVYCYADGPEPDRVTALLQRCASKWQSIRGMSDQQVAQRISEDQIDILVDLTSHMSRGRPLLFARKPAPLQVAWLAYPATTGLAAIDYRLTDPHLSPPSETDTRNSAEQLLWLPDSFWCYDPLTSDPQVNALPALRTGKVTFGCLNNFCKLSDGSLELWAQVLRAVEHSSLLLLAPEGSCRRRVIDAFEKSGIQPSRLEFVCKQSRPQYLAQYQRIDIGLDTLPYNGHTTSLDAAWMGVPVMTLAGKTEVGRAGLSQLSNLGLAHLAASTAEHYVEIARELASDLPRLATLRAGLRRRMEQSPLMDAGRFARNIEMQYRSIWEWWCAEQPSRRQTS
jgi:protein O-GlcNAc transferase